MNLKNISTDELICLVGPTASGKTQAAIHLAEKLNLELISVDSMQVYRGMDIGTAKVEVDKRSMFKLVDILNPGDKWSVGDFCRLATPLIQSAWKAGKIPCLVGGTGLYYDGLLKGLAEIPAIPNGVRADIDNLRNEGIDRLAQALQREDPAAAGMVDLSNPQRVARALEVFRHTGRSIIDWQKNTRAWVTPARTHWIGLDPGVMPLDERIEARCEAMMTHGWPEEAAALAEGFGREQLLKTGAIGYRQALELKEGLLDLNEAIDKVTILTRQYARRQRTWFKNRSPTRWFADKRQLFSDFRLG